MISRTMEAEVLRLHHAEKWPVGTIARQLMLHHSTVRRVLAQAGVPQAQKTRRPSLADPFLPFMLETLNAIFKDINDLNAQATTWCLQEAALRGCPQDRDRTVQAVFEEERPLLLPLPDNPFPTEERIEDAIARKSPYLRFDLNDYSIPHTHVGRPLEILVTLERVRYMGLDLC